MNTIETIKQIERDFDEKNPPFDDVTFPEEQLLEELPHTSMEDRAILVSMFATFDYNRDANQLVNNIIDLYHSTSRPLFNTDSAAESDEDVIATHLEDVGFRYPNRDAHAWKTNCEILVDQYNGKWTELLLTVGADAPSLVEQLEQDGFLVMKGAKVAPMYARIIDDEVAPLSNLWELDIPVDTHIARLSRELFSAQIDHDTIRKEWRSLAESEDIQRHVVDGALWHIGNKWNGWGEAYWESLP